MFSQRGVLNLAHNLHDLRELERRVNANLLNGIDSEILSTAAQRYIELGVWGKNPHLPREGFERLQDSLISGNLNSHRSEFEDCIENTFADAVIAEDPPPA